MERKPTDILHEELWEFPMDYPLIIRRRVPDFDPASVEMVPSSKGTYVSVRARFRVERKEQINGLYADLAAEPMIKKVL